LPNLAAEIVRRGHQIWNHTDTHPNLLWLLPGRMFEELARGAQSILQAAGQRPGLMLIMTS
jgi:peptidoglycan/xylan/chitin deacetylase (PgdA/CDA1 family)